MNTRRRLAIAVASVSIALAYVTSSSAEEPKSPAPSTQPATRPAIIPKPLSQNIGKGLAWLSKTQHKDGSWGQGDESAQMGGDQGKLKDSPNVADTAMATLALLRSGSSPRAGDYSSNILLAVNFVCSEIESSDDKSISVTQTVGTRTQQKLGTHIDTFLAARLLAEVKDELPSEKDTVRVNNALAKVLKKIELNQQQDGRFAQQGWATVLAQGEAAKAVNAAAARGADVSEGTRARFEQVASADFSSSSLGGGAGADRPTAPVGTPAGDSGIVGGLASRTTTEASGRAGDDAGVTLYSAGAQLASAQASAVTNQTKRGELEVKLARLPANQPSKERDEIVATLARYDANDKQLGQMQDAISRKLDDKQFVSGFGSNGGEEFLSYMNIGESFVLKGGDDWARWDKSMTENLNRIQNADGSWSGHHCITGKTFCTSAALMTLMTDRVTKPLATEIRRR